MHLFHCETLKPRLCHHVNQIWPHCFACLSLFIRGFVVVVFCRSIFWPNLKTSLRYLGITSCFGSANCPLRCSGYGFYIRGFDYKRSFLGRFSVKKDCVHIREQGRKEDKKKCVCECCAVQSWPTITSTIGNAVAEVEVAAAVAIGTTETTTRGPTEVATTSSSSNNSNRQVPNVRLRRNRQRRRRTTRPVWSASSRF